jgi:hypothetical protein
VTGFVQIIEIRTSRIDEVRSLVEQMRAESEPGAAVRGRPRQTETVPATT